MPGPLIVSIPHSLGRDEAMRRLQSGLRQRGAEMAQTVIRERGKLLLTKR